MKTASRRIGSLRDQLQLSFGKPSISLLTPSNRYVSRSALDDSAKVRNLHEAIARMRLELERLREIAEQHRIFFEKSLFPRFVCDAATLRIETVNEAAIRLYGYTRDEFLRRSARDLCHPLEVAAFLDHCRTISQRTYLPREKHNLLLRHHKRNGKIMNVELATVCVPYRGRPALMFLASDVTEKIRAEKRLNAQHATTRALAESSTVAEASVRIFQAICENLLCDWGELWRVEEDTRTIRCVQTWMSGDSCEMKRGPGKRRDILEPGEGIAGAVWRRNKILWIADLRRQPRYLVKGTLACGLGMRSVFAFPIHLGEEVLGVIVVFGREPLPPDKHLLRMLHDITSQVGQVMGRRRAERRLLEISEREQRRIGQDLHDGLCQQLAGIAYMGSNLQSRLAKKAPGEAGMAGRIAELLRDTATQARQLARGLNPVKLGANGFTAALGDLASSIGKMFAITCRFEHSGEVDPDDHEVAVHLYRIAQEAIHNSISHGRAREIVVHVARQGDSIRLRVADNGRGFGNNSDVCGTGMENMRYRARAIGATIAITDRRGGGTVLTCLVPVTDA